MNRHEPAQRKLTIMARIAVMVIALVLGHDAMMTMQSRHAVAETNHHDIVVVEQCGSTEGNLYTFSGSPVDHSPAVFIQAARLSIVDARSGAELRAVDIGTDGAERRAWLQVFLN